MWIDMRTFTEVSQEYDLFTQFFLTFEKLKGKKYNIFWSIGEADQDLLAVFIENINSSQGILSNNIVGTSFMKLKENEQISVAKHDLLIIGTS